MQLHKALGKVVKFAAKGKDAPELYKSVMLIPQTENEPAKVFATDGMVGCFISVETTELPNALIPSDSVKAIAKQAVTLVKSDNDIVTFHLENSVAIYKIACKDLAGYPSVPVVGNSFESCTQWLPIQNVIHAVADSKSKKVNLQNVRVSPTSVEATDSVRVAVAVAKGWPKPMLIPARLLVNWKVPRISVSFTDSVVFFKAGEETRYSPIITDSGFPNCRELVPTEFKGEYSVVNAKKLQKAVAQATAISALKTVALDFQGDVIIIKSWSANEGGKTYKSVVNMEAHSKKAVAFKLISGKLLAHSLKSVKTPNVRLCFTDEITEPLRIESSAWAECIWPWKVDDNGSQGTS